MIYHMRYLAALLLLAALPAHGQTVVDIKPAGPWLPADLAAVEMRLKGRLSTDTPATHKIIAKIPLKGYNWVSVLTLRVTTLVPANQTWEVKSISLFITPVNTTGIGPFEIPTLPFSHIAPPGQNLAIDFGLGAGKIVLGPVVPVVTPVVPVPPIVVPPPVVVPPVVPAPAPGTDPTITAPNKPGDATPPLPHLIATDGAQWVLDAGIIKRNGAVIPPPYADISRLEIPSTGLMLAFNATKGYACWNGVGWVGATRC